MIISRKLYQSFIAVAVMLCGISLSCGAYTGEYPFSVESINLDGGSGILAVNDGPLTVTATVELRNAINVSSDKGWPITVVLQPYSSQSLAVLYPANASEPSHYELGVNKSTSPAKNDGVRPASKSPLQIDHREAARLDFQKILEPVTDTARWLNGRSVADFFGQKPGSFVREGLPFLLVAYLLLLAFLFYLRAFHALLQKAWLPALGQVCLGGAISFLVWIQHTVTPSMYLPKFINYVMKEPLSIIPCLIALALGWLTAHWLVPYGARYSSRY